MHETGYTHTYPLILPRHFHRLELLSTAHHTHQSTSVHPRFCISPLPTRPNNFLGTCTICLNEPITHEQLRIGSVQLWASPAVVGGSGSTASAPRTQPSQPFLYTVLLLPFGNMFYVDVCRSAHISLGKVVEAVWIEHLHGPHPSTTITLCNNLSRKASE